MAIDDFWRVRANMPKAQLDYEKRAGYCTLLPPEIFSLNSNYEHTLAFIMDMRWMFHAREVPSPDRKAKLRTFADFSAIQSIEPAAGLVLAAEVDRWRIASGRQPRSFDQEWHPDVQRFFSQAGLFELLGITMQSVNQHAALAPVEALKFVRGFSVQGEPGSRLRDRLETLCGASIGPRKIVYDAIAEAIANTRHAYPSGISIWPAKLAGRWWATGSWQRETKTVSLQLYDQGVGIPSTLPKSEHWSESLIRNYRAQFPSFAILRVKSWIEAMKSHAVAE
ncbi:hypothetical protein, partial [Sphingobium sp.]|uniref:hypothetical protein n=1 Tax=Sphingobium sp. TaxID=1912891 RepID=UPI00257DB4F0